MKETMRNEHLGLSNVTKLFSYSINAIIRQTHHDFLFSSYIDRTEIEKVPCKTMLDVLAGGLGTPRLLTPQKFFLWEPRPICLIQLSLTRQQGHKPVRELKVDACLPLPIPLDIMGSVILIILHEDRCSIEYIGILRRVLLRSPSS